MRWQTASGRTLRYLAPNLVTAVSLVFGMLSVAATLRGDFADAAWWVVYATLTDRLDGFVARLVRGTSDLGGELDSLADFLNFGLAPAVLVYASLGTSAQLPFGSGMGEVLLLCACASWILAAAFRLARYNITEEVATPMPNKIFFGVPTTLAGGVLVLWYLALYKYAPEGAGFPALPDPFGGPKLLGEVTTPATTWHYLPIAMLAGAYLMASSLRIPHLGRIRSRALAIPFYLVILSGVVFGFGRLIPEYLVVPPSLWLVVYLIWGQISPIARSIKPPPVFPRNDK